MPLYDPISNGINILHYHLTFQYDSKYPNPPNKTRNKSIRKKQTKKKKKTTDKTTIKYGMETDEKNFFRDLKRTQTERAVYRR